MVTMKREIMLRHAPLAGLAVALINVLGFIFVEVVVRTPPPTSTPEQIATFFAEKGSSLLLGHYMLGLGAICLIVFFAAMFTILASGDDSRFLALAGFASSVAATTLMLASSAPQVSGVYLSQERTLSPATAETMLYLGLGIFTAGHLPAALALTATAVLMHRKPGFPNWLGWFTAAIAVLLLLPYIGWGSMPLLLLVWLLVVTLPVWRAGIRSTVRAEQPRGT